MWYPGAVWFLRATWIALPLSIVPLVNEAARGDLLRLCISAALWLVWAIGLLAALVPTSVSLTVGRMIAPLAPLVALLCGAAGAIAWQLALGLAGALLAVLAWFRAETGVSFAQGSAYGDEQRFPLKAPLPMLAPMAITWLAGVVPGVIGVLALGSRRWPLAAGGLVLFALVMWLTGSRFHQLSRRWLVLVPVGVVVHDPLLLAENALFRISELTSLHLAAADTQAADLTGGTSGVPLEIALREMDTVTKIGTRAQPAGVALHVRSLFVSPSRPGRVLAAAAIRNMPVG